MCEGRRLGTAPHTLRRIPQQVGLFGGARKMDLEREPRPVGRPSWTRAMRALLAIAGVAIVGFALGAGGDDGVRPLTAEAAAGCRIYVASGDDVTNGKELNDNTKRYPEQLLNDHIKAPGWCLFNQGKNGQTSANYITGG